MLTNSNELIGRALGTCTLKRLIGHGGMGAVYLAQQSRPRRVVAVKVLLPHLVEARTHEEFLTRFRREADAIAALDHINIMPIYEYGEQDEAAYLVMPYVIGGTLRERLEAQPILPMQDVVSIVEQVAAGLDSAHALGIIHRDLKPGNILFHADGRVLIADFGLAKMLKDVTERDSGARVLTSAGSIIGTPEYLSPEQGTGNPTDFHTDVYSLGVVLYQMLAGRVPFVGTTPVAVAIKHALEQPPPITRFNPAIPPSVEAVVMKTLAKAPELRFGSAGELARALRFAISTEDATSIWKAPDTDVPSVMTIPTTDSPQPLEAVQEVTTQEEMFKAEERTEASPIPTIGNRTVGERGRDDRGDRIIGEQSTDNQNIDDKVSLEEMPIVEVSPEEITQGKVATLSTMLLGPDVEDRSKSKTFYQDVELPGPEQPQHASVPAQDRPEKLILRQQVGLHTPAVPPPRTRTRYQPSWLIIIGGILILVIIGAGFTAYLRSHTTQSVPSRANSEATATEISKATTTPPLQGQTPIATPPIANIAPAIAAGPLLYSTVHPFSSCDKQGGRWTNVANGHVNCTANGSEMSNNASGRLAVADLNQLGGNLSSWPSQNFIVQVQITVNPNSQGAFGIDFRPQTGDNTQGFFAYLLHPPGSWTFSHYDASGNFDNTLVSETLLSPMPTQFTLDIRVEGTSYAFFINGFDNRDRAATDVQGAKVIGLVVDANADVTFSNLAIYALP